MAATAQVREGAGAYSPNRWAAPAIGAMSGLMSGLLGVGGGFLIVPLLVVWARKDVHRASGTSLAAILPTAAVGAFIYHRQGNVDLRAAALIGGVGAPAAVVGASLALALPQMILTTVFGAFLLLAASWLWPRKALPAAQ